MRRTGNNYSGARRLFARPRRPVCESGALGATRCRKPATKLVVWPAAIGGSYRCDDHAAALVAQVNEAGKGPASAVPA